MHEAWYRIEDEDAVSTPALVVYRDRVDENLRRMIHLAGGTQRLRPHVKTHKMPAVVQRQMRAGITRFKCATIAEAEMLASCDAPDVLLAYQLVGPGPERLATLVERFPRTRFSTLIDDAGALDRLSAALRQHDVVIDVLLDVDAGMGRTGIVPGDAAAELYRRLHVLPGVRPGGIHVYDGHLKQRDLHERSAALTADYVAVWRLRERFLAQGLSVPRVVAGGSPTFPIHAKNPDVECSPGTCVFWDAGYAEKIPELDFLPAALVLTRVVSHPAPDRICLDLGYKAVAADNPSPRVTLFGLEDARTLVHNEEHLALTSPHAERLSVGDLLYGIPYHICPTCAMYPEALVAEGGQVVDRWQVVARDRMLTV